MSEEEKTKKNYLTKENIVPAVVGLLVGVVITCLVGLLMNFFATSAGMARLKYGSDTVATVNGSSISSEDIYNTARMTDGLSLVINKADKLILKDKYQLTVKEEKEAKGQADEYITYYAQLGVPEEKFLKANGFNNYDEFLEDITVGIRTQKYVSDYVEKKLEAGAVQKYYDENKETLETFDTEHILVKVSDDVSEEQALALANEILGKLNEGKSFAELVEEYGDRIVHEELGYQGRTSNLEQTYIDEMVALQDGEYSKTPVKTSYGYHIVHKIATSTLEDVKPTIVSTLSTEIYEADPKIEYKALVELRKENNLAIYDESINKDYEDYCSSVYSTEE